MTSLRSQLLIGLLLFGAIMGFGTYYARETTDMVKKMPPESMQLLDQAAKEVKHNQKKSLQKASLILNQQTQKIKDFLKSAKQKSTPNPAP